MLKYIRECAKSEYWSNLRVPLWSAFWWSIAVLSVIVGEVAGPVFALGGMLAFPVGEGIAVETKRPGDTFSEWIRALYKGRPYRVTLILGITVYLMIACVTALTGTWWDYQALRVISLFTGVFVWLVPHWLTDGSKG